ncbi:MAG: hypothetical protein ABEJ56_02390 [Candidatus Nanohaloarchaea archaeon]
MENKKNKYSINREKEKLTIKDLEAKLKKLEQAMSQKSEKLDIGSGVQDKNFESVENDIISVDFDTAAKLFSGKRIELLDKLSEKKFNSISQLARELDRDKKNVSEDIKLLFEHGIVDLEEKGRSKRPIFNFSRIEINPLEFEENS